jgi:hypothetical protein
MPELARKIAISVTGMDLGERRGKSGPASGERSSWREPRLWPLLEVRRSSMQRFAAERTDVLASQPVRDTLPFEFGPESAAA